MKGKDLPMGKTSVRPPPRKATCGECEGKGHVVRGGAVAECAACGGVGWVWECDPEPLDAQGIVVDDSIQAECGCPDRPLTPAPFARMVRP